MKKQKIVVFAILASILCIYCCLLGVTINSYHNSRNINNNIVAEETSEFIEKTSELIQTCQEDIVSGAQAGEEEIVEEPIEEEAKELPQEEIILEEIIIEDRIIDEPPIIIGDAIVEENNRYASLLNNMSEEDKDLICRITFREAGNQGAEGQRAVIEVILNRVMSDKWPNTVYDVLSQSGQFSTWAGRNNVTSEQVDNIYSLLTVIAIEEPILNENYVYFDGKQHSYGKNYVKIQDHWFATT